MNNITDTTPGPTRTTERDLRKLDATGLALAVVITLGPLAMYVMSTLVA